jgi:hypothetical protein
VLQQPTTYVNPTQPLNNYSYPQQPMDNYGTLATSSTTNTPTYNTSMSVSNYAAPAVTSTVQAPQQPTYASYTSQYYPPSNTDLSSNQNLSQQTPTMSYSESIGIIHHQQQQQQKYPTVDSNSVPVSTSLYSLNQPTAVNYPVGYNAPVNSSNQAYNPYQVRPYIYNKQSDRSRQNKTKSISFFFFRQKSIQNFKF